MLNGGVEEESIRKTVPWLQTVEEVSLHRLHCLSYSFEVRNVANSTEKLIFKRYCSGCYDSYRVYDGTSNEIVATLQVQSNTCCGTSPKYATREIHGPEGSVMGYSRRYDMCGPYYAVSRPGFPGEYMNQRINLCGGNRMFNFENRNLGFVNGISCCNFCAKPIRITFNHEAKVLDRLFMMDFAAVLMERAGTSPQVWIIIFIVLAINLIIQCSIRLPIHFAQHRNNTTAEHEQKNDEMLKLNQTVDN